MSARKKLEERIRKKETEIQELEMQAREGRAYILALQEAMKLLPREAPSEGTEHGEDVLRAGSTVAAARGVLVRSGRPMHLMDILTALGKDPSPANRASLGGSLAAYVRKGEVFTRPAPNTFGLAEFGQPASAEPPSGFGRRSADAPAVDEEVPF